MSSKQVFLCEQIATTDKGQVHSFVGMLDAIAFKTVLMAALISLGFMPVNQDMIFDKVRPNDMILTFCQQHKQPYMDDQDTVSVD